MPRARVAPDNPSLLECGKRRVEGVGVTGGRFRPRCDIVIGEELFNNAAAFVAIDPLRFTTEERARRRLRGLVEHLRAAEFTHDFSPGAAARAPDTDDDAPGDTGLLPGEAEHRTANRQTEEGIDLPEGVVDDLTEFQWLSGPLAAPGASHPRRRALIGSRGVDTRRAERPARGHLARVSPGFMSMTSVDNPCWSQYSAYCAGLSESGW